MSDAQVTELIAMVRGFESELSAIRLELSETKRLVNLYAANAELIYESYRNRGEALEHLQRSVERLDLQCPLVHQAAVRAAERAGK